MFKDTDRTIFVGRRLDGSIYGTWTVRQWVGQEELLLNTPEVIAFLNPPLVPKTITEGQLAKLLVDQKILSQSVIDAAVALSP